MCVCECVCVQQIQDTN
uniref:Uncharacterized protein n=1 Tax=Anguilla anguilla TaxID=7936 RepID=A0A0E9SLH9_ANGAN